MRYTPTHTQITRTNLQLGASMRDDARWRGIPRFSRKHAGKVQELDRVAVLRYQRRMRDAGREVK